MTAGAARLAEAKRSEGEAMIKTLVLRVSVFLIAVIGAQGQTATGTIQGIVKDETGAVVVGARVRLTDQATNQSREQTLQRRGNLRVPRPPSRRLWLEAEHAGFKKQVITNIALQVAQTQTLQVTLQVGGVAESVEVQVFGWSAAGFGGQPVAGHR